MATKLTKETQEAGYQASAAVIKGRDTETERVLMQIVPLRQELQQSKTAEELLGCVKGASKALATNNMLGNGDTAPLKDFMKADLDGIYEQLGIENPLKGRGV